MAPIVRKPGPNFNHPPETVAGGPAPLIGGSDLARTHPWRP